MTLRQRRARRVDRALIVVVSLAALAASVSACGAGTTSPADSAFLSAVTVAQPDITTYRSNTQLIRLGHAACDGFAAGASYEELADRLSLLEGSDALPSQDLGAVITAAVQTICPQYRDDV